MYAVADDNPPQHFTQLKPEGFSFPKDFTQQEAERILLLPVEARDPAQVELALLFFALSPRLLGVESYKYSPEIRLALFGDSHTSAITDHKQRNIWHHLAIQAGITQRYVHYMLQLPNILRSYRGGLAQVDKDGNLPLHLSADQIKDVSTSLIFKELLHAYPDPMRLQVDNCGNTLAHLVARGKEDHNFISKNVLSQFGRYLGPRHWQLMLATQNKEGQTPTELAAKTGNNELAKDLVKEQQNPEEVSAAYVSGPDTIAIVDPPKKDSSPSLLTRAFTVSTPLRKPPAPSSLDRPRSALPSYQDGTWRPGSRKIGTLEARGNIQQIADLKAKGQTLNKLSQVPDIVSDALQSYKKGNSSCCFFATISETEQVAKLREAPALKGRREALEAQLTTIQRELGETIDLEDDKQIAARVALIGMLVATIDEQIKVTQSDFIKQHNPVSRVLIRLLTLLLVCFNFSNELTYVNCLTNVKKDLLNLTMAPAASPPIS
jgi:hypothetical protein